MFNYLFDSSLLKQLGIISIGYTEDPYSQSYTHYRDWLLRGENGPLTYLQGERFEIRKDLRSYFPPFQSALVFLFPYTQFKKDWEVKLGKEDFLGHPVIASYALAFDGEDYHNVLRRPLEKMAHQLLTSFNSLEGEGSDDLIYSYSLDQHPVMERDLAYRANLGWFGKNSMLIHPEYGSYFMIASLLLSKKLPVEVVGRFNQKRTNVLDHCGHCRACIDICPTGAINSDRTVNAKKCISTFTIEMFKDISPPLGLKESDREIFGCDRCQDVCPWNKKVLKKTNSSLKSMETFPPLLQKIWDFFYSRGVVVTSQELEGWSNRFYRRFFQGSAFERVGRVGMLKNLRRLF